MYVPGDGGVLGGVETDRAVESMVVLDVELQCQAGEIGLRQVLQPEVVEVVVSVSTSPIPRNPPRPGRSRKWTHRSPWRRGSWWSRRARRSPATGGCGAGRRCGADLKARCKPPSGGEGMSIR